MVKYGSRYQNTMQRYEENDDLNDHKSAEISPKVDRLTQPGNGLSAIGDLLKNEQIVTHHKKAVSQSHGRPFRYATEQGNSRCILARFGLYSLKHKIYH